MYTYAMKDNMTAPHRITDRTLECHQSSALTKAEKLEQLLQQFPGMIIRAYLVPPIDKKK